MKSLDNFDEIKLGLNRRTFIEEILNKDFNGNIQKCAVALGIAPNYLNDLLRITHKEAGCVTLTKIWRYAKKKGLNPETYIFVKEKTKEGRENFV